MEELQLAPCGSSMVAARVRPDRISTVATVTRTRDEC